MLVQPKTELLAAERGAVRVTPPGLKFLSLQLLAALLWLMLAAPLLEGQGVDLLPWQHALLAGGVAVALGQIWRLPAWWRPINFAFIPALVTMQGVGLSAHWYLAGFALLLLIYGGVARSQVPLYLSSRQAWQAVADRLPVNAEVADLGAGLGGLLAFLARHQSNGQYVGFEAAPLPCLFSWLRAHFAGRAFSVRWQSLWQADLRRFDVVYAYLSPVPMAALWRKVRAEMRPGTLFISNTFAVPGVDATEIVQLDDLHRSRLYLYRI